MKNKSNWAKSLTLLLLGIILFLCSNGNMIVPIAAWIAPIFLIRYSRSEKTIKGMIFLFICILVSSFFMLQNIIPSSLGIMTYILTGYYAVLWFLPYFLDRILFNRLAGFWATLIFPTAVVGLEYLNTIFFGSWASVAYTQYYDLPFIQISAVLGMWAVSFLVSWLGPITNWMVEQNLQWTKIRRGVFIYSSILFLSMCYGGLRLSRAPLAGQRTSVVSITANSALQYYHGELKEHGYNSTLAFARSNRADLSKLLDTTYAQIFTENAAAISHQPDIILWPEGQVSVLEEAENDFINRGQEFAKEFKSYLLLAYVMLPQDNPSINSENKSVLIDSSGRIVWEYLKAHPVPGAPHRPGSGNLPTIDTPFGRISNAICYDMDFTSLIHQAGEECVDIMLVPAWDWKAIDPLHAHMAVYRAIENGFSMVRQTGEGLSIATDYLGRTIAEMDHFNTENYIMISQVPSVGIKTLYSFIGDLFAWLCLASLVLFGLWPIFKSR